MNFECICEMIRNYESQVLSMLQGMTNQTGAGEDTGDSFDLSNMSLAIVLVVLAVLYFVMTAKRSSTARVEKQIS